MLALINQAMKNFFKPQHIEKIKDLKNWLQQNSPQSVQPILSYALGWLAPELLGTGFQVLSINDQVIKGLIPYKTCNLDSQKEIHLGLVVNAGMELVKLLMARHWPAESWQIQNLEFNLTKKNRWIKDLELFLSWSLADIDQFLLDFQKHNQAETDLTVSIQGRDQLQIKIKLTKKLNLN